MASAALAGGLPSRAWAAEGEVPALSVEEFKRLHAQLQPPKEGWRELAWQTSLIQAKALAVAQKKPLYILVRSGHPLGCV